MAPEHVKTGVPETLKTRISGSKQARSKKQASKQARVDTALPSGTPGNLSFLEDFAISSDFRNGWSRKMTKPTSVSFFHELDTPIPVDIDEIEALPPGTPGNLSFLENLAD